MSGLLDQLHGEIRVPVTAQDVTHGVEVSGAHGCRRETRIQENGIGPVRVRDYDLRNPAEVYNMSKNIRHYRAPLSRRA